MTPPPSSRKRRELQAREKDPRATWSFIPPSVAELAQVEAAELAEQTAATAKRKRINKPK